MLYSMTVINKFGNKFSVPDCLNLKITYNKNGDYTAKWGCIRPIQYSYDEFIQNNAIIINDKWLYRVWVGRLTKFTISRIKKEGRHNQYNIITCEASGTYTTLADMHFRGTLTSGTPESMIQQLMTTSYMRYIDISVTSGLIATGHTTKKYQTPELGTKAVTVQQIVQDLCNMGMSDNRTVVPYVTVDRVLKTRALPLVPSVRYVIPENYVIKTDIAKDLLSASTVVMVLYKDSVGASQFVQVFNNAICNNLGSNFGAGLIAYTRQRIVDITGLGNTDSIQATATANTILNYAQTIKTESKSIDLLPDTPVIDTINGIRSEISAINMRPNEYARVINLSLGLNSTNQGVGLVDSINQDTFLISEIEIDNDTGSIRVTPDTSYRFNTLIN